MRRTWSVIKSERTPSISWNLTLGECQKLVPEFRNETMKNVGSWDHLVRRKRICVFPWGGKKVVGIFRCQYFWIFQLFTIGIPYSNFTAIPQDHGFCSKMIDRAIDLHDACRITPTNHGFSVMLSPKVIRKIKTFDPAVILALAEVKEIFFE